MSYAPYLLGHEGSPIGGQDGCWFWEAKPWRFEVRRTKERHYRTNLETYVWNVSCALTEVAGRACETEDEAIEGIEDWIESSGGELLKFMGAETPTARDR